MYNCQVLINISEVISKWLNAVRGIFLKVTELKEKIA